MFSTQLFKRVHKANVAPRAQCSCDLLLSEKLDDTLFFISLHVEKKTHMLHNYQRGSEISFCCTSDISRGLFVCLGCCFQRRETSCVRWLKMSRQAGRDGTGWDGMGWDGVGWHAGLLGFH